MQLANVEFLAYCQLLARCNYTIITKWWQLIFYKKTRQRSVSKPYTHCIANEQVRRYYKCNRLPINIV